MNALRQYDAGDCEKIENSLISSPSLLDNLKKQLVYKEAQAADIKKAIDFLEANPQFEEFSKLITKARF